MLDVVISHLLFFVSGFGVREMGVLGNLVLYGVFFCVVFTLAGWREVWVANARGGERGRIHASEKG